MKITKGQLRRIIKEVLLEATSDDSSSDEGEEYVGTQAVKVDCEEERQGTEADLLAARSNETRACKETSGDSSECNSAKSAVVTLQKKLDSMDCS